MNERKGLTRELQISLGGRLRDHYNTFLQSLPLELVLLARKIRGNASAKDPSFIEPLENTHWNSFDPETVAILNEAFEKAWQDLDHLTANPATRSVLATRLIALLNEGERNPSRLATKAVLELVAPQEQY
jgi:hypothetical protein